MSPFKVAGEKKNNNNNNSAGEQHTPAARVFSRHTDLTEGYHQAKTTSKSLFFFHLRSTHSSHTKAAVGVGSTHRMYLVIGDIRCST